MKITEYFKKTYNKLLHKKPRREIWGRRFDGYVKLASEGLVGRIVPHIHNEDIQR